jgi:hypothetical protein
MKKSLLAVAVAIVMLGFSSLASAAALDSGAQTITLNATLNESLTLSLSGNLVNFTLAAGSASNAGSAPITATTKWILKPGRTAVTVNAYFSSTSALTDGAAGDIIPASAFQIKNNGGTFAALTNTTPYSTSGLQLENIAITGTNKNSSSTDAMQFNIDLSAGSLPQLPAGAYTGTLNIQAQATP